MVDICQWRAAIGRFHGVCFAKLVRSRFGDKFSRPSDSDIVGTGDVLVMWICVLFLASFVVCVKQLLICSVTVPFVHVNLQAVDVTLVSNGSDNVAVTQATWIGLLLMRCGDVELNPGPVDGKGGGDKAAKTDSMRQTRLNSAAAAAAGRGGANRSVWSSPSLTPTSPHTTNFTLTDLMMKLNSMDAGVNAKLDGVSGDIADIKERFGVLQEEVGVLSKEVEALKVENGQLREHNDALWTQMNRTQKKVDDLEGRSKRQNVLFYGMDIEQNETNESLELRVKELLTDKLEMAEDVEFDRVHRTSDKPNAPVIAKCTFYKHKVSILKHKNKLKGSNIFVGEDYSQSVRDTRKKLTDVMKTLKGEGKNVKLVFDHLYVDGKRMYLSRDGKGVVER